MPNIRGWRCDANLFAAAMASRRCVCCKAHLYLQIRYVRQRGGLCRGATVYAASRAQPNIRRNRCDANLFAIAMASCNCGCRKATVYLQIEYRQATGRALPRRYSICGKLSAAEYTKKPARCKLVCNCNGFSQMCVLQGTLISPNRIRSGNGECYAEALQYMRQAERCRIYEETGGCKLVCNSNGFSQMCVLQGTLISPNKIRQATGSALPRRYSICGKHSAAESSLSLLPYDIRFPPQQEPALYGRMAPWLE